MTSGKDKNNILIVDDEPANIKVLMPVLVAEGYEVRTVLEGKLALASALKKVPDLILLDVRMPEMDGFEVCRLMKVDKQLRSVPIIFISALGQTEDIVQGLSLGGVDYITKPFRIEEVLARIRTQLSIQTLEKQLRSEIEERRRAEKDLQELNLQLEQRVADRTTDLYARTIELSKAKEAAEAANIAKSKFLSNISHEIRTPLNPVMGYAQILKRQKNLTVDQKEQLQIICDNCAHLTTLIGDILELARVDTEEETVDNTAFNLKELLLEIRRDIQQQAGKKQVEFKYEEMDTLPEMIVGDGRMLRQVLVHLLDNGVKFTDEGSVTFRSSVVKNPGAGGRWRLRFDVEDTGVGIPPEIMEDIYTPFYQGEIEGRVIDGTGLGLTLCHKLVELMGGNLSVNSRSMTGGRSREQGSTFTVELDLGVAELGKL